MIVLAWGIFTSSAYPSPPTYGPEWNFSNDTLRRDLTKTNGRMVGHDKAYSAFKQFVPSLRTAQNSSSLTLQDPSTGCGYPPTGARARFEEYARLLNAIYVKTLDYWRAQGIKVEDLPNPPEKYQAINVTTLGDPKVPAAQKRLELRF